MVKRTKEADQIAALQKEKREVERRLKESEERYHALKENLTDRRKIETEFLEETKLLQLVMDCSFDGINICEYDIKTWKRRLVFCNDRFVEMSGRSREKLMASNDLNELITVDLPQEVRDSWHKFILEGVPFRGGTSWDRPDGKESYYEWLAVSVKEKSKTYTIEIDRDITERKVADEKLARRESIYREAIENAHGIPYRMNWPDKGYEFMGSGIKELIGIDKDEISSGGFIKIVEQVSIIKPKDCKSLITYQDLYNKGSKQLARKHIQTYRKELKEGKVDGSYEAELLIRMPNGQRKWISDSSVTVRDEENGKPLYHLGFFVDITGRKLAEEELVREHTLLRTLIDHMPDTIYIKDGQGKYLVVSKSLADLHGLTDPEGYIGKTVFEFPFSKGVADETYAEDLRVIESGEAVIEKEEKSINREGRTKWLLNSQIPLKDKDGTVTGLIGITKDITEIKLAHEAVAASEAIYRQAIASAQGVPYQVDLLTDEYVFVGSGIEELIGIGADELNRMVFRDMTREYVFTNPVDSENLKTTQRLLVEGNKDEALKFLRAYHGEVIDGKVEVLFQADLRIQTANGEQKWLSDRTVPIKDERSGKITGLIGIIQDITERKQWEMELQKAHDELELRVAERTAELGRAVEELREAEERFRTIFEHTVIGMYRTTPDGRILMANPAMINMLGFSSFEQLAKRNLETEGFDVAVPRSVFKERVEKEGRIVGLETMWMKLNGENIFVREIAMAVRDDKGKVVYYEGTVEDITERKEAEAKLLDYQGRLRSLASELSLAEEKLRRRIANDVHDQIGQNLAICRIKLDSVRSLASSQEFTDGLGEVGDLLGEAIESTRSLTFELSPPVLYELGFEAGLKWLVGQARERYDLSAYFEDDRQAKSLNEDKQVFLFQAVRELLVNVVKHAQAKKVTVVSRRAGDKIVISVVDDGVGFNRESEELSGSDGEGGFGLFNIRERLGYMDGEFTIRSSPGKGTEVILVAPLDEKSSDTEGAE